MHLPSPLKFLYFFLQNFRYNDHTAKTWEDSKIFLGTNKTPFSTALTECFVGINDSGFFKVNSGCQNLPADVITFRREPTSSLFIWNFYLYVLVELRAYQCRLLPEAPGISVTWTIGHTQATDYGTSPDNLLSNYGNRSPNINRNPYINSSYTEATYGSCYKAECIAPGCLDTKFSLTVTFSESVYLHALFTVLDSINLSKVNSFEIINKTK